MHYFFGILSETIVPHHNWKRLLKFRNKAYNTAVELVVRGRVPRTDEMRKAHEGLRRFALDGFPRSLLESAPLSWRDREFLMYREKFLASTWNLLAQEGLAKWVGHSHRYGIPAPLGFFLMSLLADACAGTQIQKVTDRVDAYAWLSEYQARKLGADYVTGLDASQVAPAYNRLVTLSVKVLDAKSVPIERLVALRKREAGRGGTEYRALRRKCHSALLRYIDRLRTEVKSSGDLREIEHQFMEEMKHDLAELKSELGLTTARALFSKEVAVSALAVAGALIEPISGLTTLAATMKTIGVAPLVKTAVEYRAARREALKRHAMSWLFLSQQRGLTAR